MPSTSRYIQITEWALLEYEYSSEEILNSSAKAFKIENAYTDTFQFINGDIALSLTGNVLDRNSVPLSTIGNRWAYTDIDTIIPTIQSDSNLTLTEVTSSLTSNIKYDNVKLHIVSGFNLDGLEGLIANVAFLDRSGVKCDVANYTYRAGESSFNFSTTPLFLGDRLYDKYIEFKVPALSSITTEFNANPANPGNFSYVFSKENEGFIADSLIQFTLHEISTVDETNGNLFFVTGNKYETSFLPADTFGLLAAIIKESDEGDYFEYYATWDNQFPETYVANLNSVGGQWVFIHQLEIYELIGPDSFRTNNMTILQDTELDKPNIFRPVIINSSIAFSFSIDYVMRFFNRANGQQIIRKSSLTSLEPKKYGKEIEKITVSQGYRPVKVYNKIVNSDNISTTTTSFLQNSPAVQQPSITTKYIPTFFDNTNIAISTDGKNTQELDDMIWGQGKAIVLLNEYDNRIRFKLFDRSSSDNELEQLNLTTAAKLRMSFVFDNNEKFYIDSVANNSTIDPTAGEVEFLIISDDSVKILDQKNMNFYIISVDGAGTETVVYQGKYDNFSNRDDVITELDETRSSDIARKLEKLRKQQAELEKRETDINKKLVEQEKLLSLLDLRTSISDSKQIKILDSEETKTRKKLQQENELVNKQKKNLQEQFQEMLNPENRNRAKFRYREIPGNTVDLSVGFRDIRPTIIKPSDPDSTVEKNIDEINIKKSIDK